MVSSLVLDREAEEVDCVGGGRGGGGGERLSLEVVGDDGGEMLDLG